MSVEFSALNNLAIPKSVSLTNPRLSSTKFSGLISRWMILFLCKYSSDKIMQAMKNSIYLFIRYLYSVHWISSFYQYETLNLRLINSPSLNINVLYLKKQCAYSRWMDVWLWKVMFVHLVHCSHFFLIWLKL